MNLRSLKVFKTVCESKSMTAAGKKLYMSQPAISQTITKLEKEVGIKLFERIKNRLELTYGGKVLYKYSKKIIRLTAESEDMLHQIANLKAGKLRIGASMTIGTYILPDIINNFKKEHQELKMPLYINNTDHIVDNILNNDLDIAFVEGPFKEKEINSEIFRKDELIVVSSPDYFSKKVGDLSLSDIAGENFILREKGSGTRDLAIKKLEESQIDYKIKHVLNNFEAIKKAITANFGLSILPKISVREEVNRGELVILNIEELNIVRDFKIIYHDSKYHSPFFSRFKDYLKRI